MNGTARRAAGDDLLHANSITSDGAEFSPSITSISVAAGDSRTITITFAPEVVGPVEATLTITSDDPDEAVVPITLRGVGG